MKHIFLTTIMTMTALAALPALAEKTKKHGVPPGLLKRGTVPPGQAKKESVPPDLFITNEPITSVTTTSAPPVRPLIEDNRVESPRGSEVLPVGEVVVPRAKEVSAETQPDWQQVSPATKAKQERDLDALLVRVVVNWSNPRMRAATFDRMASETGATPQMIEAQMKVNPKLSGGDLLMGNKIAALSGKPAVDVFNAHALNGRWLATGESFGVQPAVLLDTAKRFVESDK